MDLFHRHRSKYYALVRHWYSQGILENQEQLKNASAIAARDFLDSHDAISTLKLHEKEYFLSSLSPDFDPVLPLLFTSIEKRYLKTYLNSPLFTHWLGTEATCALSQYLHDTSPFPFEDFFQNMNRNGEAVLQPPWEHIVFLYESIIDKRMVSFAYEGTDGVSHQKQNYFPYRLMLDKELDLWQLLAFTQEEKLEVVCNLVRMVDLSETEEFFSEDLQVYLQQNREKQNLLLRLRPTFSGLERCFLLFHDYPCEPSYDKKREEYHLSIQYNPDWDTEDVFTKILSLGSAIEVLQPKEIRDMVISELEKM